MESANLSDKIVRDAKRSADHKHKWKLGDWSTVAGGKSRPQQPPRHQILHDKERIPPSKPSSYQDNTNGGTVRKSPAVILDSEVLAMAHDSSLAPYSTSLSSAGSVPHDSRAPVPTAGVAYSYDAARGPSDGSDVLGQALNKAVLRFEDKKTTSLVKDEYDVVKGDEEDDLVGEMVEDFELVGKFEM